jgi:adenosylhomocysteinase
MSEIADPTLAAAGEARIAWADGQMPVLRSIRERFESELPLDGLTVAACLHVTPETANLMRTLAAGGARVALCAANPYSTADDVAAALATQEGIEVLASYGESPEAYGGHVMQLVEMEPDLTLDDGADLISVIHAARPDLLDRLRGGTEETTTGLVRLRAMERAGELKVPVIAVNEAGTERAFNDRYGTGQSALDGILRATNILLAVRTLVVLGYGWAGKGVAMRAAGLGATVIVCEVEPMRALEARMDGFEVLPAVEAAARGDVFVTVTGGLGALRSEHFEAMKDGAILANAGHFDVEIDLADLARVGGEPVEVRPLVSRYLVEGKAINLVAGGRVVNLAAAEGHPAAVMDMSFATQALSIAALAGGEIADRVGVQPVPVAIDDEVARLKLSAMGVAIDDLSDEQLAYIHSWRPGSAS